MGFSAFGQFSDYKYIIVPTKFDAFRKENMYQTSTTVKYLLTKRGFNAVYDNALPEDVFQDRCLGLIVNLENNSSFLSTKATIVFRDCRSVEVFRTIEGRSKIKEFRPAYNQAISRAFVSLDGIDPTYKLKNTDKEDSKDKTIVLNFKDDVKTLDEKPKEVILEQKSTPEEQTYKSIEPKPAISESVAATKAGVQESKEVVLEQKATLEEQTYKSVKPKPASIEGSAATTSDNEGSKEMVLEQEATPENQVYKSIEPKPASQKGTQVDILYAQPIQNGFQLVDSSPKIRYKLVETSVKDFYLVSEGEKTGLVFQKEGVWRIEYVENGVTKVEELNIKF